MRNPHPAMFKIGKAEINPESHLDNPAVVASYQGYSELQTFKNAFDYAMSTLDEIANGTRFGAERSDAYIALMEIKEMLE